MGEPIEVILLRQWSSYIALPVWIMDEKVGLLFYNEAAEPLMGQPFEESGAVSLEELGSLFVTTAEDGSPLTSEQLPIGIALVQHIPAHRRIRFTGWDGVNRLIDVTAFPITGHGGRNLGAVAMFWEVKPQ